MDGCLSVKNLTFTTFWPYCERPGTKKKFGSNIVVYLAISRVVLLSLCNVFDPEFTVLLAGAKLKLSTLDAL